MRLGVLVSACLFAGAVFASEPHFERVDPAEVSAWTSLRPPGSPEPNPNRTNYTPNYDPHYAIDDDPTTAWVEGAEGNGEGQKLFIWLTPSSPLRALRLRIRNGYQKSSALLAANAAPKDLTITLSRDASHEVFSTHVTLAKELGWQQVELVPPAPVQVGLVTLRIDSVHPGAKFKDTCISDVQVLVDSDPAPDPAAEKANRDQLAAWLQDQRSAAKYAAQHPPHYPFAAGHFKGFTHFDQREPGYTEGSEADPERRPVPGFVPLEVQAATGKYGAAWRKVFDEGETARIRHLLEVVKTKGLALGNSWQKVTFTGRIGLPVGLGGKEFVDYLDRSNFQLSEAESPDASIAEHRLEKRELERSSHEWTTSNVRVVRQRPPALRELYFWRREVQRGAETRDGFDSRSDYLILFDDQDRAEEVLELTRSTFFQGWKLWSVSSTRFFRDRSGRIEKISAKDASYVDQGEDSRNTYGSGIALAASEND